MHVIHSLGGFLPDAVGGTEVYVAGLANALRRRRVKSTIAAADDGAGERTYIHDESPVYRYPVTPQWTRDQVRGTMPHGDFQKFALWLEVQDADIYHQHTWTTSCGRFHLQTAKALGLKTVLTMHVPGQVCMRGTMLYRGTEPCDGIIDRRRCGTCWRMRKNVPPALMGLINMLPDAFSRRCGESDSRSSLASLLATKHLIDVHQAGLRDAAALADRIIVPCEWLRAAAVGNGIDSGSVVLSRQGCADNAFTANTQRTGGRFIVGYIGRCAEIKGIDTLIRAFKAVDKTVESELHVYARPHGADDQRYYRSLQRLARDDARITLSPGVAPDRAAAVLSGFHLTAVPSRCMETGPLVVYESHAAGTPVLGSRLGGIEEIIEDGVDGLLIPHDDVKAWTAALQRCYHDPELMTRLRSGIKPVRTFDDVAADNHNVYLSLLQRQTA